MEWQRTLDPQAPRTYRAGMENLLDPGETLVSAEAAVDAEAAAFGLAVGAVTLDGTFVKIPLSVDVPQQALEIWDFGGRRFPVEITAVTSAARTIQVSAFVNVRNL